MGIYMREKRIRVMKVCIIPMLLSCIFSGCSDTTQKETQLEESIIKVHQTIENTQENIEEMLSTENTKNIQQETAEQWAKGYGLPVDEKEQEEAETECSEKMELLQDVYKQAYKGEASNVILNEETVLEIKRRL